MAIFSRPQGQRAAAKCSSGGSTRDEHGHRVLQQDWDVEDVHGTKSYDLICRRGDEVKHVEVKGTTTDGAEVILTRNEVRHAREHPCTVLFVVSDITVERAEDGTVTATGGKQHPYDPWHLDDGTLTPLGFRYQVPVMSSDDALLAKD